MKNFAISSIIWRSFICLSHSCIIVVILHVLSLLLSAKQQLQIEHWCQCLLYSLAFLSFLLFSGPFKSLGRVQRKLDQQLHESGPSAQSLVGFWSCFSTRDCSKAYIGFSHLRSWMRLLQICPYAAVLDFIPGCNYGVSLE